MAAEKRLEDLFLDTLKDIYYAEKQIVKTLPKMAEAAQDPKLKAGFEKHLKETEGHVERLEQVFDIIPVNRRAPRPATPSSGLLPRARISSRTTKVPRRSMPA